MIETLVTWVGVVILLRWHSFKERHRQINRKLHALVHPLNHYLTLLDHELQNANHHPDPLPSQAVLDHVTEFRSLLIRPDSKDLNFWGEPKWVKPLNSVLLRLEENLESALQGEWEEKTEIIQSDVKNLLLDLQNYSHLKKLIENRVGLVEP
ncbi:MAG: hypothetical protein ACK5W9_09315 [Bdellovibrionales bacterium]